MRGCTWAWLIVMQCALVLLTGCTGGISGGRSGESAAGAAGQAGAAGSAAPIAGASGNGMMAGASGTAGGGDGCTPELRTPRAVLAPLRQYQTMLRDLFGQSAVRVEDESLDIEFEVIERPRMSTGALDQVLRLAERATDSVRGRTTTVLSCASLRDRACVQTGLASIARRAFKRAPATDELTALMGVYDAALALPAPQGIDAAEDAALTALLAVLTAPSTLYRTEFEARAPEASSNAIEVTLTADERAAAIAALLLDSVPDAELLAAADSGALLEPRGVQAEVSRLLALPRVQAHLTDVMLSGFKVTKLFQSPKDQEAYPEYTPALQLSMYEETRRFLEDALFTRGAPLRELLTSRNTFVDPLLAELYGVSYPGAPGSAPGSDDFVAVTLPQSRAGILTQPSVLSVLSRTDNTSVVARGLFVRGAVMCLSKIPGPPPSVQAQVEEQLNADATQVELAEYRAVTSPCMGCHAGFDRFGLVLEQFDAIGREQGSAEPIDLTGLAKFMGSVSGASELAQTLTADTQFVDCLAERVLAYALSEADDTGTGCVPDSIATTLHAPGASMSELISAVVVHPAFNQRALAPEGSAP